MFVTLYGIRHTYSRWRAFEYVVRTVERDREREREAGRRMTDDLNPNRHGGAPGMPFMYT